MLEYAITQKKHSEEILENLPEPIIIVEQNEIKYANKALKLIDLSKNEHLHDLPEDKNKNLGEPIDYIFEVTNNMLKNDENASLSDYIKKSLIIKLPKIFEYNYFDRRKDKHKTIPFEVITNEIVNGNLSQIIYSLKSLYYFEKLKHHEVKAKEKYTRIFLSSITHNFRTPLNMIMGNAELILIESSISEIKHYANYIIEGSHIINILIDQFTDYSMINAGTFKCNLSNFNIREEISKIGNLFNEKFENKGLFFEIVYDNNLPEEVLSDIKRIKLILYNLLSNAYKFTSRGGVRVKLEIGSPENNVTMIIEDTGIGINSNDFEKIFQQYGRLNDSSALNPNGKNNKVLV